MLVHLYSENGWTEPGAFAMMRTFLDGSGWSAKGLDIDTTADRVWNRPRGSFEELTRNYGELCEAFRAPGRLSLPEGYLLRENFDLLSAWNGPQVQEVAGPGWSNNREGFPRNPSKKSHGNVWAPSDEPRILGLMPADAPGILAVHRESGVMGSLLQVWHALRDGSTQEFFEEMDRVVRRETGKPMDMKDVFVVCVLGARVGFGLNDEMRDFLIRNPDSRFGHLADDSPESLDPIFRRNVMTVATRFSNVAYTVEDRPYDLDLGRLAYELTLVASVNGTTIPESQVIFDPRCTLTWRNERGERTRQSKRLLDGELGEGAFTGEKPAARHATCWSGFAVAREGFYDVPV